MLKKDLRIVFMGTPEIAETHLKKIVEEGFNVVGVFTNIDKQAGRGNILKASPVKEYALSKNIEVYQPVKLRNNAEVIEKLKSMSPDVIIVVAYGKILPIEVLDFPKYGCINVHASLLPKYRGAAPMQWAIINGETKTGVSIMYMDEGMDTGDVIITKEIDILPKDTLENVYNNISDIGSKVICEVLQCIVDEKKITRKKQEGITSYAPMLNNENTKLDFSKSAQELVNLIRGVNPFPTAWCKLDDIRQYKIYEAEDVTNSFNEMLAGPYEEGEIIALDDRKNLLLVKCKDSILNILKIKPAGSRIMTNSEYIRSRKINAFEKFI